MRDTPEYRSWRKMRDRCNNPRTHNWKHYGGRGITICQRWASFPAFLADMGMRPAGSTLDRRDVNGPYEPGNCRWASQRQQLRNRRNNVYVLRGGRSQCVAAWLEEVGIPYKTYNSRRKAGWLSEDLFLQPDPLQKGRLLTWGGRTQNYSCWAQELRVPHGWLMGRMLRGMTDAEVLAPFP
jgi:hypothetical protein